jgi:hypothetical protein
MYFITISYIYFILFDFNLGVYNLPVRIEHGQRNFKDTHPLMSASLVILFGVVKQFCRF